MHFQGKTLRKDAFDDDDKKYSQPNYGDPMTSSAPRQRVHGV